MEAQLLLAGQQMDFTRAYIRGPACDRDTAFISTSDSLVKTLSVLPITHYSTALQAYSHPQT